MKHIAESVLLAPGAQVVGQVQIGEHSSVWYNAVIRGDTNPVVIGEETNIQDNAVLHVNRKRGLSIGNQVTIGHGAIVHGCTVGDRVLIGMGSIILDGAVIEEDCIIGAGALVTQNKLIPAGSIAYGNPAKIVRQLTEEEKESILVSARNYCEVARNYCEVAQIVDK